MSEASFCADPFIYRRRVTREVGAGKVVLGGTNPIRVQSMLTCDTMDTAACVKQTLELVAVGCEIVRITAPTVKDAANLRNIKQELAAAGCDVPIVADIHFKPDAAMEAAQWVEAVRINPGNFADSKKFKTREYTDDQYAEELSRIEEVFLPLIRLSQQRKIAMRIGTNHGSLSDRIMNRFGDTPAGMVESAMEYARVARKHNYHDFVFSMKSSNPKVMIQAYRLLVQKLDEQGPDWNYPIHLGVTEAGDGEDGRIKSAIGIGSLLLDGIGDTIRVSLTEDSVHEIPVAQALVRMVERHANQVAPPSRTGLSFDPYNYRKRKTAAVALAGAKLGEFEPARVLPRKSIVDILEPKRAQFGDTFPDGDYESAQVVEVDLADESAFEFLNKETQPRLVTVKDGTATGAIPAIRYLAARIPERHSILIKDTFHPATMETAADPLDALLYASAVIGSLLCDGIGDAVVVRGEPGPGASVRLAFNILQGAGNRIFKTEYVACPSCGRTLFDLQSTTAKIRSATNHLKGVKIAIMGCIVNGPGEMADADFGYVGGAPGKVNLYVGKTPVKFNIPEGEAVTRLTDLIKENGKWAEPSETQVAAPI